MATKSQGRATAKLERRKFIRTMMVSGRWVSGISNYQVAAHFGVAVKTIELDAAEASREVRNAVLVDEELRAHIKQVLQFIGSETIRSKQYRTAVEALRVMAGMVEAPKEINLNGGVTLKDLAELRKSTGANKP